MRGLEEEAICDCWTILVDVVLPIELSCLRSDRGNVLTSLLLESQGSYTLKLPVAVMLDNIRILGFNDSSSDMMKC